MASGSASTAVVLLRDEFEAVGVKSRITCVGNQLQRCHQFRAMHSRSKAAFARGSSRAKGVAFSRSWWTAESSSANGVACVLSVRPLISSCALELVIVISVPIAAAEIVVASAPEFTTAEVVATRVAGVLALGANSGKGRDEPLQAARTAMRAGGVSRRVALQQR